MPDAPLPQLPDDQPSTARKPQRGAQRGAWTVALGDALLPADDPSPGTAPAAATLKARDVGTLDPLEAGAQIGGYKILGTLGRGGFGITYRAREISTGRHVAIKEFFPVGCVRLFAGGPSTWAIEPTPSLGAGAFAIARAQFLEGARALSRFRHPSLAAVGNCFEAHGTAYLVMELLSGRTLQQSAHLCGPLDEEDAILIAHALGEAASMMHRLEFLHLDIKPENVMLCPSADDPAREDWEPGASPSTWCDLRRARVVLFDFDLLQRVEKGSGLGTRPLTSRCGTPGYAPLEQYAQHAPLGPFSDVYALGATILSLLTSHDPLAAADRALSGAPLDVRALRPDLSHEAASAIEWAMEMSPRERPQSIEEWLPSLSEGRPQREQAADSSARAVGTPGTKILGSGVLAGSAINGARVLPASLPASLPQPAALPALPIVDNWYQLAAREPEFEWPYACACCGRRPDVSLQVRAGKSSWGVPYCARCARHVRAAHQAGSGTTGGILAGLAVAFLGWAMSDFWIGPIGVAIHFSSLAYGALKVQSAEALMRPRCCDRKHAVSFGGERETRAGRKYLVRFRSLKYAHEWKAKNAAKL